MIRVHLYWGYKLSRAEELLKVTAVCTTVCNLLCEREDVTLDPNKVRKSGRWSPSGAPGIASAYPLASEPVHVRDECNRHGDPIRECQGRSDSAYHTPRKRVGDGIAEFDGTANVRRCHSNFSSADRARGKIPCAACFFIMPRENIFTSMQDLIVCL